MQPLVYLLKVSDGITYPFPNFSGAAVEVWKWIISNFIPHFTEHVITIPVMGFELNHVGITSLRLLSQSHD